MAFAVRVCRSGKVYTKDFVQAADVTFEDISAFIRATLGLEEFVAKYADEDGDACTLTKLTLSDAIEMGASASNVLKLQVTDIAGGASACTAVEENDDACSQQSEASDEWVVITSVEPDAANAGEQREEEEDEGKVAASQSTVASAEEHFPSCAQGEPSPSHTDQHPLTKLAQAIAAAAEDHQEISQSHPDGSPKAAMPPNVLEAHMAVQNVGSEDSVTVWDKLSIIIAAFDADGDGRLSLAEFRALQEAAASEGTAEDSTHESEDSPVVAEETYHAAIFADLGMDVAEGLGCEELSAWYARYATLERDFSASQAKLQEQHGNDRDEGSAGSLIKKLLPAVALVPFLGIPGTAVAVAAVAVAGRLRRA